MDLKNKFKNNYEINEVEGTLLRECEIDEDKKEKIMNGINVEEVNETKKEERLCLPVKRSEAVVFIQKPLCADYNSESDSDSDSTVGSNSSESENSISTTDSIVSSTEDAIINDKETRLCRKIVSTDIPINDLPPIEDLKINVPEKDCLEIGIITNIVDVLVVVEAFKGTPALDVDTVLFLDFGRRTLGKIFEVLGPITEPVYAIRFNSKVQILDNMIKTGLTVYYAPKSLHTSFVFLAEVMKIRGSDASWKDNVEAPPEYQDFSDDETEEQFKFENVKQGQTNANHMDKPLISKKHSFNFFRQKNSRKMRDNRFCEFRNFNRCFRNNIGATISSSQKLKWTSNLNSLNSISSYNIGNPFYTQSNYTTNSDASSSQAYVFPSLPISFPFAKTMPPVEHSQYFQNHSFPTRF